MSSVESTRLTKALGTCGDNVKIDHFLCAVKDQQAAVVLSSSYSFTRVAPGLGFRLQKINGWSLAVLP